MDTKEYINKTGVIVVDIQADFTQAHDGALAVDGTDSAYLDQVDRAVRKLGEKGHKIFATQDFHPPNHISFVSRHAGRAVYDTIDINGRTQVLWPEHCVQKSSKAKILLAPALFTAVVQKGTDSEFDSYSGFFDDGGAVTGLDDLLKSHGITNLLIFGLALDYCVRFTALDAAKIGYGVTVIKELCKGVAQDSTEQAMNEMQAAGIVLKNRV